MHSTKVITTVWVRWKPVKLVVTLDLEGFEGAQDIHSNTGDKYIKI